jgi:hypothetical protein
MTAQLYRLALARLRWSHDQAARELGVNPTTSWRWARGDTKVPAATARLLEMMLRGAWQPLKRRA